MQRLEFEAAWDKTIAKRDREKIIDIFQGLTHKDKGIVFTFLKQAINHRNDLLLMVLIHNYNAERAVFKSPKIRVKKQENIIAEYQFERQPPDLKGNTSIPWTFIFPQGSYVKQVDYSDAELILITKESPLSS
ncbi:SLAP domain-containing protein [Oceanobacillus piezotolerans]|uniref:SLAP domain-containing protein n=1 Tax=Oceanobacillus piezotolerans TaxID=2448030 RepID=A0A498DCJ4_9BACI|nr:SLAP domain-containing protein [Oceanobacillus piezotolerans]RLL47766.1 SLAP domain-containing protein [Oceanobacillus piezotolerans]